MRLPKGDYEDSWVERFNRAGFLFFCIDQLGHGESGSWQGVRCNVPDFNQLVNDGIQFIELIHQQYTDLPIFVTGNSMGGNVCAQLAQQNLDFVTGFIPIAAMLALEKIKKLPRNRVLVPLGKVLAYWFPHMQIGSLEETTEFPWISECIKNDELCNHELLKAKLSISCLDAVDKVQTNAHQIKKHILILHSKGDTMCEPEGAQLLFDKIHNAASKKLVIIEKGWHCLTQEETHEKETFALILNWIEDILKNEHGFKGTI